MAPFFGDSTIVWANTIAIVLVALSIGYWFGGRLADRHPHLRGLCLLVLAAVADPRPRPDRRQPVPVAERRRVRLRLDRHVRRLAVRRARARRGPGADARRRLAVGDPAEAARRRGLGRGRRAAVRDLDRRLARRDVPRRAAADPARRDAAHVPGLRARARRWSPRSGSARAGCPCRRAGRRAAGDPARGDQGLRRGPRDLRDRDEYQYARVVEHAGRRAPAGAQRGPGDPLDLPARALC